jgi:hypothetical protein
MTWQVIADFYEIFEFVNVIGDQLIRKILFIIPSVPTNVKKRRIDIESSQFRKIAFDV